MGIKSIIRSEQAPHGKGLDLRYLKSLRNPSIERRDQIIIYG